MVEPTGTYTYNESVYRPVVANVNVPAGRLNNWLDALFVTVILPDAFPNFANDVDLLIEVWAVDHDVVLASNDGLGLRFVRVV